MKVLFDRSGTRVEFPYEVNLWEGDKAQGRPSAVSAPLDPATLGIDPLTLL